MVVSAGLQKYFDGKQKKSGDMDDKLQSLMGDLDPRFLQSFQEYRKRVFNALEENPDIEETITTEVVDLGEKIQARKRQYNMKKAAIVIDASEAA